MTPPWVGRRATQARRQCMTIHGFTCWLCGRQITDESDYSVDHVIPRSIAPELTWDVTNWRPAHLAKHPEFGCPGNRGRGATPHPPPTSRTREW